MRARLFFFSIEYTALAPFLVVLGTLHKFAVPIMPTGVMDIPLGAGTALGGHTAHGLFWKYDDEIDSLYVLAMGDIYSQKRNLKTYNLRSTDFMVWVIESGTLKNKNRTNNEREAARFDIISATPRSLESNEMNGPIAESAEEFSDKCMLSRFRPIYIIMVDHCRCVPAAYKHSVTPHLTRHWRCRLEKSYPVHSGKTYFGPLSLHGEGPVINRSGDDAEFNFSTTSHRRFLL